MKPDFWSLYRQMLKSRLFEEAVTELWQAGKIPGEMHLGTGEEAIVTGVVDQLREGDALALDHRGTAALLLRGIDPVALLKEFMGHPNGICRGMGGHMHLFFPDLLAASSGIVGASGPAAVGFGLAAQLLRPATVCIAFFGEGAMNQGMLLEALNLAVVWQLPVLFVCKQTDLAITTVSNQVTSGSTAERARAFGMPAREVDGRCVEEVWRAAEEGIDRARNGGGPMFIKASCVHLAGHFLGDPLLRRARDPIKEMKGEIIPLFTAVARRSGVPRRERLRNLKAIMDLIQGVQAQASSASNDPIIIARQRLEGDAQRLEELERNVREDIERAVADANDTPASDRIDSDWDDAR